MTKTKFKDLMIRVKNKQIKYNGFVCFELRDVFTPKANGLVKSGVEKLYVKEINGVDTFHTGMFGSIKDRENRKARLLSLEIFETIVLENKLYKEL